MKKVFELEKEFISYEVQKKDKLDCFIMQSKYLLFTN